MVVKTTDELSSLFREVIGLNFFHFEVRDEIMCFSGNFSGGRAICGNYKSGKYCHVYVQYKNFDPVNPNAIQDFALTQKTFCSFFEEKSKGDISEDQDWVRQLLGLSYMSLAWGSVD